METQVQNQKEGKLNNTEYHKKYLDFLWSLYNKTFSQPVNINLRKECKDAAIDRRIIPVLIKEDIIKVTPGRGPKFYTWAGHNPDITMCERVVRLIRLSRRKGLKTGKQQIKGWKKGKFTKEEEDKFIAMVREGYIYPAISSALNRSTYLLRKHKYRLKKRGVDFSPVKPFSYTLFDQGDLEPQKTNKNALEGTNENSVHVVPKTKKKASAVWDNAESQDTESLTRYISGKIVDLKTNSNGRG